MVYPSRVKENLGEELLYSPLALAYLGRHTPYHYDITAYDEYVGENFDPETVAADLVAVSAITPGIDRAYEIADKLKKRGITCVTGGAHVSALPDEALRHFDSVIIGEGEGPWRELLKDFENGKIQKTYFGPMNVPLDDLGTPRRDLIHPNYHYPSVLTTRGCPYNCTFCYLTVFKQRKFRTIPHSAIMEDLNSVKNNAAVIITDENFIGYSSKDIEDRKILCEKIIRKNFNFVWGCQASINLAEEPELMSLMYRAGCRAVFVGFETIDEESLKEIKKKHNIGVDYKDAIAKIHQKNIAVIASSILGLDSHKKGYHKKLISELKRAEADFVRVFFATAWPGTPFYEKLKSENRLLNDWTKVRKDVPSIKFKHYTHKEAIKARKEILDSFFNVFNIGKILSKWLFKDTSLFGLFIKMSVRNRVAEIVKTYRKFGKIT
jgi:radical SAM superfamily enzyme YgiQ (UPF0313 family)